MFGNSSPVSSSQVRPHARLEAYVASHREHAYRRPVSSNTALLFDQIDAIRQSLSLPVILDSGCGNAASTFEFARRQPQALVIGVDKSARRLGRYMLRSNLYHEDNVIIARADLISFWQLATASGWQLQKHYLLYPNPWPKHNHLLRRWYAHPVFPAILQLGGRLEVRSNWDIYVEEFRLALIHSGISAAIACLEAPAQAISPFERKYAASGHRLYQLSAELG